MCLVTLYIIVIIVTIIINIIIIVIIIKFAWINSFIYMCLVLFV